MVLTIQQYQEKYQCYKNQDRIEKDLSYFKTINKEVLEKAFAADDKEWKKKYGLSCRPQILLSIKDGMPNIQIYKNSTSGFIERAKDYFNELCKTIKIPDVTVCVNLVDSPVVTKEHQLLVLSPYKFDTPANQYKFSRDVCTFYGLACGYFFTKKHYDLYFKNIDVEWNKKKPIAFWRGSSSGPPYKATDDNWFTGPRFKLCLLSKSSPYIDAKITNLHLGQKTKNITQKKSWGNIYSLTDNYTSMSTDQFVAEKSKEYKYMISIDGNTVAGNFPKLLSTGSLVFKQESPCYEYWYDQVKPYKHYIPFKRDLSDLEDKILWAQNNDEQCSQIAQNGKTFMETQLRKEDTFYHIASLLTAIS